MSLQNSKNKNIRDLCRGINKFRRGYQPQSNLVKDESGDLLAESDSILNRWKNYFAQLLNVCIRQIEIRTAEPLVCGPILLRLKLLLQSRKSVNCQVVIKVEQNHFKQEEKRNCDLQTC
jgi:hypothetical protein